MCVHEGKQYIYLCGNSLGLQPKSVRQVLGNELDKWKNLGVEVWCEVEGNWINYLQYLKEPLAKIVGEKPPEVTITNVNNELTN